MKTLTDQDKEEIAAINKEIERQQWIRDRASAEIEAQLARLGPYEHRCGHPNGYQTSCMGDLGFYCPDCGYSR